MVAWPGTSLRLRQGSRCRSMAIAPDICRGKETPGASAVPPPVDETHGGCYGDDSGWQQPRPGEHGWGAYRQTHPHIKEE
jgi:hypothetical protein